MTLVMLYIFSIGRMFFAFEFPYARVIPIPRLYNGFFKLIKNELIKLHGFSISLIDAFMILWGLVSCILIVSFIIRYIGANRVVRSLQFEPNERYDSILLTIQRKYQSHMNIHVNGCYMINLPTAIGLINKQILIPPIEYSDNQIRYILLHEYMHFRNKDLPIKLLVEIFVKIFWWNPLVYMLRSDISQILEIKCDMAVVSDMTQNERAEYLRAIARCLAQSSKLKALSVPAVSTQLIKKNTKFDEMKERFVLVADPVPNATTRFKILLMVCFAVIMVLSYLFILQPDYEAPTQEIVTDHQISESGTLSGYIIKQKNGTYVFIDESGLEIELQQETVDIFLSDGFVIKEE